MCMPPASEPAGREPWRSETIAFRAAAVDDGPDEICWRRRRLVMQDKSDLDVAWRPWLADQSIDVRVTEEPEGATRAETLREQYGS
jgi:hypothetical protein